jgi:hypothetical protein
VEVSIMGVLNLIKVGATALVIGAAVGSTYQSYRTWVKAKETTKDMKAKNEAFTRELEQNLRDIGGEELVNDFRRRMAEHA